MPLTQITTGGVDENINIDSNTLKVDGTNNRVGIGTASPTETLTLNTASGASIGFEHNGTEIATINNNAAALYVHAGSGKLLSLGANGSEAMRIDSSGNVGIGTSSPQRALVVSDAGTEGFEFYPGSSSGNNTVNHYNRSTASFVNSITTADQHIFGRADGEKVRIDSSGRLLVGGTSTSNTGLLCVKGNASSSTGAGQLTLQKGTGVTGADQELGAYNLGEGSASTAKIRAFTGANWTGSSRPTHLTFETTASGSSGPTERMRITSDGKFGFNTTNPGAFDSGANNFVVLGNTSGTGSSGITIASGNDSYGNIYFGDGTGAASYKGFIAYNHNGNTLRFGTDGSERMRIDSSGSVLIGSSTVQAHPNMDDLQLGDGSGNRGLTISSGTSGYGTIAFGDSADSSGNDRYSGSIEYYHADNSMRFYANIGERMRIMSSGSVLIGTTSDTVAALSSAGSGHRVSNSGIILQVASNADHCAAFNRTSNDGGLIGFRQNGTQEGTISVSGTTISYNGAHLARWSQLPGGAERTEILRGSVLSNLDEMCEWGEEDNEQLNRMKVSDVEGDKNVSGVFQAWDDDDDTYVNDFYCAMTGDFVIRIAQGTTVARGDLLMSAGDGTAKPQDDDIVRSKTIAKVTSTTVSTTYSDNSYCVPCVLMAC